MVVFLSKDHVCALTLLNIVVKQDNSERGCKQIPAQISFYLQLGLWFDGILWGIWLDGFTCGGHRPFLYAKFCYIQSRLFQRPRGNFFVTVCKGA